jgi:hypothetical protein
MSADEDTVESQDEEKKSYSFVGRFLVFLFIAGPASVFAIGIYGRIGLRDAIAATERGSYTPMIVLGLWGSGSSARRS